MFVNLNMLALLILMSVFVFIGMKRAENLGYQEIRSLPPVEAFDEAISRAAEMGKPVLYHCGGIRLSMYTIPGVSLLGHVAELCIDKGAHLIVTAADPVLFVALEDVMKTAYIKKEVPVENMDIRFLAGSYFSYAAAIQGLMMRERPATHFLMGETDCQLIVYTETGTRIGAFQIGGTAGTWNLPMMAVTCDYTLIGEEFLAAGAVITNDVSHLGTLVGQDWSKTLVVILLLLGSLLTQLEIPLITQLLSI